VFNFSFPRKINKENLVALLIVLFFGLTPLFSWFEPGEFIAGVDWFPPFHALRALESSGFVWNPQRMGLVFMDPASISPFHVFWGAFELLGINYLVIQKLWYVFVLVLPGLAMFYCISVFIPKKINNIGKVIASLFYMFNVVVFSNIFSTGNFSAYILMPLLLGILAQGLRTKRNKYILLLGLAATLFSNFASNPRTFGMVWLVVGAYFLFYFLFIERRTKRLSTFIFFLKFVFLYIALNLWWESSLLITLIGGLRGGIGTITESISLDWVLFHTSEASLLNIFRLLGLWSWEVRFQGAFYYPYSTSYTFPLLVVTTFLIPFLSFLSLILYPKSKKIYFLVLLCLVSIFLAKGIHAPFMLVNKVFYKYVPGFILIRNPIQLFRYIMAFTYAILIGIASSKLYIALIKKRIKSVAIIISLVLVAVILINGWPLLTGDVILHSQGIYPGQQVKIPDYWFRAGEWVSKQESEFKIFRLPVSPLMVHYNWGYLGIDRTAIFISKPVVESTVAFLVYKPIKQLIDTFSVVIKKTPQVDLTRLAGLLNVKYFLQRNDLDWTYFGTTNMGSPEFMKTIFDSQDEIRLVQSFGELDVYEVSDEYFLPHFYIPQNIIYSPNNIEVLPDIVSFEDYEIRSGIYVDENGEWRVKNGDLLKRSGEIFVKAELEDAISEEGVEITIVPGEIFFPYVKHKPGSLGWKLARLKERYQEWKVRQDIEKLIEKKLFYALKRISELEEWGEEEDTEHLIQNIYKEKMEEVIEEIGKLSDEEIKRLGLIKLKDSWEGQKEKLVNLEIKESESWKKVTRELDEAIKSLEEKDDLEDLEYSLDVPKSGNYQLLIKNEEFSRYLKDTQLKLEILGEERTIPLLPENDNWITGGSYKLESGEQELKLAEPQTTNLLGTDIPI